ncbi:MAG: rhodanese-like domain-containing protein [Candidatus Doudnabacteria bacterium CG10_big_fil_rev_8_21_14_0_10_41_10]|uniref:Rhodanese-like domain-containing protein n=1 Tax=Candidatus Doudnabacteria bacterium CG10_big_fil_rev_8_21_14_0_10_41_10 TaxID=1974551 RepID=A0A2H0VD96_9BACT|nr:MAG: rhodanese-like domain-containing protein [Candidatus Doudnabacteria bacterium CG10_big_fil_rev_8_21_14_0_10_41_10]
MSKNTGLIVGSVIIAVLLIGFAMWGKGNFIKTDRGPEKIVLDVRTQEEWDEGHVLGAEFFDLVSLEQGKLPDISKDTEISVYCRSGRRAGIAKEILDSNGFTNVTNIGGLEEAMISGLTVCDNRKIACD